MKLQSSMRIGVDIRFLSGQKRSGVEEYAINLLENLIKSKSDWQFVLFYNLWGRKLPAFDWLKAKNVEIKTINFPGKILSLLFFIFRWPRVDKLIGGADIFFMPNFAFISLSKDIPLILTVHDLSFLYFRKFFNLRMRLWQKLTRPKYLIKRASKIIAVSNSTKNDILKFYPQIDASKIEVIYHGISEEFRVLDKNDPKLKQVKKKYNLPDKFVLYLGIIEPRKNIESVIKSFNAAKKGLIFDSDMKLVIVGNLGWCYKGILNLINKSPCGKDIIMINNLSSESRVYVYNLADMFIYPSFFEGFGLPILEAMSCGLPIITSNTSSMPEVVGNAGILINPCNINDLILVQKQLLSDEHLRKSLILKGLERVKNFSWQKCASETMEILERIIFK